MRRSTGIYILVLAALVGLYYYLNDRTQSPDLAASEDTPTPVEYLFTPADGLPTLIRVKPKDGETVEAERNAENVWVLKQPIEAAADQGLMEAAASQVSTMRVLDHVPDLPESATGLARPSFTITLRFTSGMERTIKIGVLTPTQSGYYARDDSGDVFILTSSSVDSLIELANNPPYVPTETPLPITPELGPAPEETATPQP